MRATADTTVSTTAPMPLVVVDAEVKLYILGAKPHAAAGGAHAGLLISVLSRTLPKNARASASSPCGITSARDAHCQTHDLLPKVTRALIRPVNGSVLATDLNFAAVAEFNLRQPARREYAAVYRSQLQVVPQLIVHDEVLGFRW